MKNTYCKETKKHKRLVSLFKQIILKIIEISENEKYTVINLSAEELLPFVKLRLSKKELKSNNYAEMIYALRFALYELKQSSKEK